MTLYDPALVDLLFEHLGRCRKQADHLEYSLQRARDAKPLPDEERLERYEALTSRFARLQDMLVAPFKTIALLEFEPDKAERIPDLLSLMEKLTILTRARDWLEIRRTRNAIAHEYSECPERMAELVDRVRRQSRILIAALGRAERYADEARRTA